MIVFLALLGVVALLAVLPGWLGGPLSWLLVGYVLWRAYPAVRADLRMRGGVRPGLRRSRGGAHL